MFLLVPARLATAHPAGYALAAFDRTATVAGRPVGIEWSAVYVCMCVGLMSRTRAHKLKLKHKYKRKHNVTIGGCAMHVKTDHMKERKKRGAWTDMAKKGI